MNSVCVRREKRRLTNLIDSDMYIISVIIFELSQCVFVHVSWICPKITRTVLQHTHTHTSFCAPLWCMAYVFGFHYNNKNITQTIHFLCIFHECVAYSLKAHKLFRRLNHNYSHKCYFISFSFTLRFCSILHSLILSSIFLFLRFAGLFIYLFIWLFIRLLSACYCDWQILHFTTIITHTLTQPPTSIHDLNLKSQFRTSKPKPCKTTVFLYRERDRH